jgi:hypothetical protein
MNSEICRTRARDFLDFGRNHADLAYLCVRLAEGWEQAARDFETGVLKSRAGTDCTGSAWLQSRSGAPQLVD